MIFKTNDNPLKDEQLIKEFEVRFQKKLPLSYLGLLKIQNGGRTNNLCFKTKNKISLRFGNVIPVWEISGIGQRQNGRVWTINNSDYLIKEWDLPRDILILFGEGHWWVVLDYRLDMNSEPTVSLIDLEFQTDIVLSENFQTFISSLETISDNRDESNFEGFVVLD